MARIVPLDPEAISQLQSSKHITTSQGVILALVENSLDAGSTKIVISTDFRRAACEVEDNGCGIPAVELSPQGGLGKLYHTSKHDQIGETHGVSGTFLASLAALCLLSITSKHGTDASSASLTLHQSKVISRHHPAPPAQDLTLGREQGTRVLVRDLFGNMPVRLKQRALSVDDVSGYDKAWYELKSGVIALLLAWNRPCSATIKDNSSRRKPLQLSTSHSSSNNMLTERILRNIGKPDARFDIRNALPVLGQGELASNDDRASWVPVSASVSKVAVTGVINLRPAPTKRCQFISIGIHPCGRDGSHNDLYDSINRTFANSSFGYVEDATQSDREDAEKDRRKRDRRYKTDGYTRRQLNGRKGVDRWPMFVLKVVLKTSHRVRPAVDDMNAASLKSITDVLEAAVTHWLELHYFRPHKRERRTNQAQKAPSAVSNAAESTLEGSSLTRSSGRIAFGPDVERHSSPIVASTSKKRKYVDMSGASHYLENRPATMPVQHKSFASWSRIKSGRESFYSEMRDGNHKHHSIGPGESVISKASSPSVAVDFHLPPLDVGALNRSINQISNATELGFRSSNDDFGSIDDDAMVNLGEAVEQQHTARAENEVADDGIVQWTDPVTMELFSVNARTGVVLPANEKSSTNTAGNLTRLNSLSRQPAAINTSLTSTGQSVTLARRTRLPVEADDPQWLPGFLKEWKNPVFAPQEEEHIPVASIEGPGIDASDVLTRRCSHEDQFNMFAESGNANTTNITKAELKNVKVVRQVDEKYILCKVKERGEIGHGERLVLVDQHAASERVILEQLLAETCHCGPDPPIGAATRQMSWKAILLERPLHFVVSSGEHELLRSRIEYFADWNIVYDLTFRQKPQSQTQVRTPKQEHLLVVKALPPSIAERSMQSPNLVIDLIRSESHRQSFIVRPFEHSKHERQEHPWLSRIGSCPRGLLDMLNSRACRSAIMFNDELSVEQCEQLIQALSGCAFPFICAHGRVSMVPLVELAPGSIDTISSTGVQSDQAHNHDTTDVYRKWLADTRRPS